MIVVDESFVFVPDTGLAGEPKGAVELTVWFSGDVGELEGGKRKYTIMPSAITTRLPKKKVRFIKEVYHASQAAGGSSIAPGTPVRPIAG